MSESLDLEVQSLYSPTSDDYYTPPAIFEALGLTFDIDPCAPEGGIPWIPVKEFYTKESNGLAADWYGKVWMNPPYSEVTPWMDKFIQHGNGVCLVPAAKSRWLARIWEESDCALLMPTNLKFVRGNGYATIQFQTMMFALGDECADALRNSGLGGWK